MPLCSLSILKERRMGNFPAQIAVQEWWSGFGFWVLVAGLAGELAVLAIPEHRGRLEKLLSALFTVVVIVGCAFEHVADNRISDLVAQEEALAGAKIADANAKASDAAKKAGELGVKVETLPTFVARKETEINGDIGRFQQYAATSKTQADAAIHQLAVDTAALDKARTDAQAAAKQAEAQLAAMKAANTPRTIVEEDQANFVSRMKTFSGIAANIFTPPSTSSDAGPLAGLLGTLLEKADWKVAMGAPIGGWAKFVLVCVGKNPKPNVQNAAKMLVLALRAEGIQSFVDFDLGPNIPLTGAGDPLPNPDMTILVGAKQ